MIKALLLPAILTGMFCGAFAMGIDFLTDMLARQQVLVISFISGFLGSIFASVVLKRWKS